MTTTAHAGRGISRRARTTCRATRRDDGQASSPVDHRDAIRLIKQRLATIPNVLSSPAPDGDVLQFTPAGPRLCVRPYCNNQHYWQVYFDTNRLIREAFGEAGFPVPAYAVSGTFAAPPLDTTMH